MINPSELATNLIGREADLALARQLLGTTRLLTLTGPGGSGKTRLARALIDTAGDMFPDGAAFVSLASVNDPALVPASIATALDITPASNRPIIESVQRHLANRRLLLALDNFEQVVDAAGIVSDILDACPAVTVLVTSRVRLRLSREQAMPIPPLRVPDDVGASVDLLSHNPAVQLFVVRARAIDPGFALSEANATAIGGICRRLGGLPLAIELAAARTQVLAPQAIADRLDSALSLLTSGPRDAPPRQRTVRNAIAWSYDLLDPSEQRLFRQLSVFAGGWTLDMAEAVCDGNPSVLEGLASLVDHNLVRQSEQPGGSSRFWMLETIREFGQEQLTALGERGAMQVRHATYMLDWAEQQYESMATDNASTFARMVIEHNNIRAALSTALAHETANTQLTNAALRATCALWFFWRMHGLVAEGRDWLDLALARSDDSGEARCIALNSAGFLAAEQGDFERAIRFHEESLAIAADRHDDEGLAFAAWGLGRAAMWQGDFPRAIAAHEQGIALARRHDNAEWLQGLLGNYGAAMIAMGDLDRAEQLLEEGQAVLRNTRRSQSSPIMSDLGLVALLRGQLERAAELFGRSLAIERQLGPSRFVAMGLESYGWLAALTAQPQRAATLLAAATALRDTIGAPVPPAYRERHATFRQKATDQLDAASWSAAWELGRAMPLDDAIDLALGTGFAPESEGASSASSILSKRELDVLRLLVGGQSNQEIAAALHISPNTVANHVASIMNKLGVDSRTAAATWAVRHDIE